MSELKLSIELVPNPLWGRNLHNLMSRKDWDRLRKQVYEQHSYRCGVCGSGGRMTCHEIWNYDDVNHIQRLTGFVAICDMCNNCKHMGRSLNLARQGVLDFETVIDHFCRVNIMSRDEFKIVYDAAFEQWRERNKYEWTQDFGEYTSLIAP